jgi:hypothetical protein
MVMFGKKMFILCLLLCFLPLTFAADGGVVDEPVRVSFEFFNGVNLFTVENVTLHLYNANGTIITSNANMTLLSTGLYYHDFTPNSTGNHLAIFDVYNGGSKIEIATRGIYVTANETVNNMIMAITLAILGLGFLAAYISHNIKLEEIPTGRIVEKALYYALSFIFLLGTPIFLLILAENNPALSYIEGFLNTSVVVTSSVGLTIMIFYFIYHMRKRLERIAKIQNEIDDDHTK